MQDEVLGGTLFGELDYGARFYDPVIARFKVQDRLTEKYFDSSPYNYCAGNPISFVDVNGDSIWIVNYTGFLGLGERQLLRYENGKLFNQDGTEYAGKINNHLRNTVGALDKIGEGESGQELLSDLQSSEKNIMIQYGKNTIKINKEKSIVEGKKIDAVVGWNNSSFNENNERRPSFIGLGHELGHAHEYIKTGQIDMNDWYRSNLGEKKMIRQTEKYALHWENRIRAEHGVALRNGYTNEKDGLVIKWEDGVPKSIYYEGYVYGK